MKLKLQFTASVSNPPPDARPLSRKHSHEFDQRPVPEPKLLFLYSLNKKMKEFKG